MHLRTQKDWTRQLALIKTKALQKGVQENINPNLKQPTALEELSTLKPKNAIREEIIIHVLKVAKLEAYKIDRDDQKGKKKLYNKKKEVLNDIEDYIIRTTSNYQNAIKYINSLYAKLIALKVRVTPTNYARETDALKRQERANQSAKSTRTEEQVAEQKAALIKA